MGGSGKGSQASAAQAAAQDYKAAQEMKQITMNAEKELAAAEAREAARRSKIYQ